MQVTEARAYSEWARPAWETDTGNERQEAGGRDTRHMW